MNTSQDVIDRDVERVSDYPRAIDWRQENWFLMTDFCRCDVKL
jgi:hypothetical protein